MGIEKNLVPDESREALEGIKGAECSLVESSYGRELVLGFGPTRPSRPPLKRLRSEWMLFMRDVPWALEDARGAVATDRSPLTERVMGRIKKSLLQDRVRDVEIRNEALGLTMQLMHSEILLIPKRLNGKTDPIWELATPNDRVLQAIPRIGLRLRSSSARPPEGPPMFHNQPALRRETDPLVPVKGAGVDLWQLLIRATKQLSCELHAPVGLSKSGLDALVLFPNGKVLGIQMKSRSRNFDLQGVPTLALVDGPATGSTPPNTFDASRGNPSSLAQKMSSLLAASESSHYE